jgi:D-ribose pyranose/furanose isomerase RbsD
LYADSASFSETSTCVDADAVVLTQATKCDDQQAITEVTDAYGNVTEIKAKKTLTKKEIKKMTKEIKAKIKSGAISAF